MRDNVDKLVLGLYIELLNLSTEEMTELEAELCYLLCKHPHIQKIFDEANKKVDK